MYVGRAGRIPQTVVIECRHFAGQKALPLEGPILSEPGKNGHAFPERKTHQIAYLGQWGIGYVLMQIKIDVREQASESGLSRPTGAFSLEFAATGLDVLSTMTKSDTSL